MNNFDPSKRLTRSEAEQSGFTVDSSCSPWLAYKGPRFNPKEAVYCYTDLEAFYMSTTRLSKQASFRELSNVLAFHQKFKLPMATIPSWLPASLYLFRLRHLQEELLEFEAACDCRDMQKAADALVDLVYVAHGISLMMGLPWPMLWEEVHRKNLQKERALRAENSARNSSYDVLKPAGWEPPDHTQALGTGPWPILKLKE